MKKLLMKKLIEMNNLNKKIFLIIIQLNNKIIHKKMSKIFLKSAKSKIKIIKIQSQI